MKFRDKDGNRYNDIRVAIDIFCDGKAGSTIAHCKKCSISSFNNGTDLLCLDFCVEYPAEAANLMGYEVIENGVDVNVPAKDVTENKGGNMVSFENLLNIEIGSKVLWVFDHMKDRSLEGHSSVIAEFNDNGIAILTVKTISKIKSGWVVEVEEYPNFGIAFEDFGKTAFLENRTKDISERKVSQEGLGFEGE